jgi:hypothetical protein
MFRTMRYDKPSIALFVFAILAVPSFAKSDTVNLSATAAGPTFAFDGVISAGEYGVNAPQLRLGFAPGSSMPTKGLIWSGGTPSAFTDADMSMELYMTHNSTTLYLGAKVFDTHVFTSNAAATPWLNSGVEFFFNPDNVNNDFGPQNYQGSKEGFQLVVDAAGHQYSTTSQIANGDWQVSTSTFSDSSGVGYMVEVALPFSIFDTQNGAGFTALVDGNTMGFNLGLNNNYNGSNGQPRYGMLGAPNVNDTPHNFGEPLWNSSITIAPEPSSVISLGLGFVGIFGYAVRTRQRTSAIQS